MAAPQNNQTPGSITYVTAPTTSGPLQVNASASSPNQRFNVRAAKITGGIQIACAVLSVMLGVQAILIATCAIGDMDTCRNFCYSFPAVVGWPIWGGVSFYGVAGILGVCSGNRYKCVIVAYMVMSIMSSVSACGQLIIESIGAAIHGGYSTYNRFICYPLPGLQVVHSLGTSAVVAFVEMVVAIVSAAYCCHGVCFKPSSPAPQQIIVQYQPNAQGQVFQQPPPGTFQLNTQGQVFHQAPAGPFQPNVQAVSPPPNVQPDNPLPQEVKRSYQEFLKR